MKDKIIGIIPARMAASRFPGKPLKNICGIPMLMHVYQRAKMFKGWSEISVAGCDSEIADYCQETSIPYISLDLLPV